MDKVITSSEGRTCNSESPLMSNHDVMNKSRTSTGFDMFELYIYTD